MPKRITDKIEIKIMSDLDKLLKKKITAIHLKLKDDNLTSATFIFNNDVVLENRKTANT